MANEECVLSVEGLSTETATYPSWLEEDLNRFMGEEEEDEQRGDPTTFPKPQIQTVPEMLGFQNNLKMYIEPRAGKTGFLRNKNFSDLRGTYKSKLLKRFIKERSNDKGKDLYIKIWNNIKELENCFAHSLLSRDVGDINELKHLKILAERLFLDGCLTLQFIYSLVGHKIEEFGISNYEINSVTHELFLLENQLPYQLLKLLMNGDDNEEDNQNDNKKDKKKKSSKNKYKESIKWFICMNVAVPLNYSSKLFADIESIQEEPAHLLELLLMAHVYQRPASIIPVSLYFQITSLKSAKELNNVGITFKPNKSGTFRDVAFATRFLLFGELTLAPLIVDDSTISTLINMVAWETCTYGQDKFWVTSYICFINSLLRGPEDVKVLSSHNIIFNYVGNEQQVVDLFRDISNNLIPQAGAYDRVFVGIEEHLSGKLKLLIAEWLHAHFSSTWSVLAFLGAIFAIVLTLIQTYFTACPLNKG